MPSIELEDLRDGYVDVVNYVLDRGEEVSPRGQKTVEVQGLELVVNRPWDVLPVGVGRGVNTKIAALEALQLIGGVARHDLLERATRGKDGTAAVGGTSFRAGGQFGGGYGNRIRTQLDGAISALRLDPDTRGAVITTWDPLHDLNSTDGVSYMCTVGFQFIIRDGALSMHVNMRSNDAWLGLAYDAFQFTQLQLTVAGVLGVNVGRYYHRAASMHLYQHHWKKVDKLQKTESELPRPAPMGVYGKDAAEVQRYARNLLDGQRDSLHAWYGSILSPLFD